MEDRIIQGDALASLKTLPSESVDMCITSPPYWGLRDYGMEGQLGQESDFRDFISNLCDIFDEVKRVLKPSGTCWANLGDTYANDSKWGGTTGGKHAEGLSGQSVGRLKTRSGLPQKSLAQIPTRFAIEMTDRGWILRNEIIWHKPNAMPQSVKDRFSVDFEKLFFFTKSKTYHFDQQFDELAPGSDVAYRQKLRASKEYNSKAPYQSNFPSSFDTEKRNKRAVWSIPTKPYAGAHFATYPEDLIETPILAGCPIKGLVLDPFFGSGTTGVVAMRLDRKYLGLELNPEYIEIAEKRLAQARVLRNAALSQLPLEAS